MGPPACWARIKAGMTDVTAGRHAARYNGRDMSATRETAVDTGTGKRVETQKLSAQRQVVEKVIQSQMTIKTEDTASFGPASKTIDHIA